MVTDNVPEEKTSTEETTSQETEEQSKESLTEERVQQLIAEATTKAVTEARELGRRELQGEQDRNRNTERRARLAESRVNAYETSFKGLDEDAQKDVELAKYREQEKYYQSSAQEEAQKQQNDAFYQRMNDGVLTYLDNLSIPRDDKRLDWGTGAQDYVEARNRLDNSVAKIVGENKKVAEDKLKEDFKSLESSLRKELNLDTVDVTTGSGAGGDSDADFKRDWGSGALPSTKANIERARKLETA